MAAARVVGQESAGTDPSVLCAPPPPRALEHPALSRPRVRGAFLSVDGQTLLVKGVECVLEAALQRIGIDETNPPPIAELERVQVRQIPTRERRIDRLRGSRERMRRAHE
jgi:hypothetical protein